VELYQVVEFAQSELALGTTSWGGRSNTRSTAPISIKGGGQLRPAVIKPKSRPKLTVDHTSHIPPSTSNTSPSAPTTERSFPDKQLNRKQFKSWRRNQHRKNQNHDLAATRLSISEAKAVLGKQKRRTLNRLKRTEQQLRKAVTDDLPTERTKERRDQLQRGVHKCSVKATGYKRRPDLSAYTHRMLTLPSKMLNKL
jgi:hypothetical protein